MLGIKELALMLREEVAVDGEECSEELEVGSAAAAMLLEEMVEAPGSVCGTGCGDEGTGGTVSTNLQDVIEFSILKGVDTEVVDTEDVVSPMEDVVTGRGDEVDGEGIEKELDKTGQDLQRDL